MSKSATKPMIESGKSHPLGATPYPGGVNFSVYSKNASEVEIVLFDDPAAEEPSQVIALSPRDNRTFHYWHAYVPGLRPGQIYAYRAHGPWEPHRGLRFDGEKALLDPYGKAVISGSRYSRVAACLPGSTVATSMKSVVVDSKDYDWEGDRPLHRPFARTVIYEMHVRGFTRHPSSNLPDEVRGTFAGLAAKIPYLVDLGVTAVELMPVFCFDEQDGPSGLVNYWGYSPVSLFAPHVNYSSDRSPLGPLNEFRDMVKALHRAGIEVILDVVYNHSAEGNHEGPTLCWRGLENSTYYLLEPDQALYSNYSGTGNTLNANHSVVRRLIIDSLRYWVEEMHVDGFRFDLASVLSRDETGRPIANPPTIWTIESDPVLAGTKIIAEAWDAAGLYQVGSFVGDRWMEWNGKFRDDVRCFLRGDGDTVDKLPARLLGSPDLFGHENREPDQSINFCTCHDGFTLNDLVSYSEKHNEANREGNLDGSNSNFSWNCGVEGPTDDAEVERLRNRQVKNFLALTLLSLGTPMLTMGDEVRRTQRGNNNPYCQDNEISWFDWTLLERHGEILRFTRRLVRFRLILDLFQREFEVSLSHLLQRARIHWHGVHLNQPDWRSDSHSLAFTVENRTGSRHFHVMINAYWEPLDFELPPAPGGPNAAWWRIIDTSLAPPEDFCEGRLATRIEGDTYRAESRSFVLLVTEVAGHGDGAPTAEVC